MQKLYRAITYIFFAALLCHVLFTILLIFSPDRSNLTDSRIEKVYRLLLAGPFFSEDRINTIPRVYVSIKEDNEEWREAIELGKKEFEQYHRNYFDYSSFSMSILPKYLCWKLASHSGSFETSPHLESIRKYIVFANPDIKIDSVTLTYTLESLVREKSDTIFHKSIGGFDRYFP